jgi:hypothetical protein
MEETMTRALPLAAATLAIAACSAPDTPRSAATPAPVAPAASLPPVVVQIQVPEDPGPAVEAWAQALAAAIDAGHGGLALARTPEEAVAVVRIDAVETGAEVKPQPEGEGEVNVMRGALVVGENARAFNLVYRGDAQPQAEALARNLRRFAAEGADDNAAQGADEAPEATPEDTPADAGGGSDLS